MAKEKIRCERCGELLNPKTARWLELSATDGDYYADIPASHESQGSFSFGTACAVRQLQKTASRIAEAK